MTDPPDTDRRIDRDHFEASPSTGPVETPAVMDAVYGLGDRTTTAETDEVVDPEATEPSRITPTADPDEQTTPLLDGPAARTEGRP